jgi:hypothetical protein
MRLPADKVKEGVLHTDQDVREAAAWYFAGSSDPAIMPLVIQAIEKYGFDNAFSVYSFLKKLVQTDETVSWLIRQLNTLGQPANEKEAEPVLAYIPALIHADPTILKNHESEILAMDLDHESREAINERIWFPSRSGEELWGDLEEFCQTHEDEESLSDEDFDFGCRLG